MIIVQEGHSVFDKVQQCLARGIPSVLCTVIESTGSTPADTGSKMLVLPDGNIAGTVGGGIGEYRILQKAREILEKGPRTLTVEENLDAGEASEEGAVCGGSMTVFLEQIIPAPEVVIFGGGHVGQAILRGACFLGWQAALWDDRREFTVIPERHTSQARSFCCPLSEVFSQGLQLHENSFILVATRGHAMDSQVVTLLEDHPAKYIGMIGSRNKIETLREMLLRQGIRREHLDRIYQPVGLPLHARTPEEIAISVLAEMVAHHRSGPLHSLRAAWGASTVTPGSNSASSDSSEAL